MECAEVIKEFNPRILQEMLHRTGTFPAYGHMPALRECP
jgi:hypothetical protein